MAANTHYAVIRTTVPPSMELVAAGPREHCANSLVNWIRTHPLSPYQVPLLLVLDGAWLPTTEEELRRMVLTDPGVSALYKIAHNHARGQLQREIRG